MFNDAKLNCIIATTVTEHADELMPKIKLALDPWRCRPFSTEINECRQGCSIIRANGQEQGEFADSPRSVSFLALHIHLPTEFINIIIIYCPFIVTVLFRPVLPPLRLAIPPVSTGMIQLVVNCGNAK